LCRKENIGLEKLTGDRIAIRYQIGGQETEQQIPSRPAEEWLRCRRSIETGASKWRTAFNL
jgi:hypothetical protein